MRAAQMKRHFGAGQTQRAILGFASAKPPQVSPFKPTHHPEFAPRDYITYLLSIGAEIEHCLMVQYLYAAYSLGGPQVPETHRADVRQWQEIILGIAREEMGHLISTQNVLRAIGAPLHLEREDYPWDVPFYPFPFALEALTLDSLAKYVYAESPVNWNGGELGDEIRARVHAQTNDPHQVAQLFNELIPLVEDESYLSDDVFQPNTYLSQANWDEWGRGYVNGMRGNTTAGTASLTNTPNVLVVPVISREQVVNALKAVAQQGEATTNSADSHFVRFLRIYVQMRDALENQANTAEHWDAARPEGFAQEKWTSLQPPCCEANAPRGNWIPARNVATNPFVSLDDSAMPELSGVSTTRISHPESALWARLHNLRYRMLLNYLIHSFTLQGGLTTAGLQTPRGTIINATFGEMYNLRAIAEILMQSPVSDKAEDGLAGPPFQMPYTLNSPINEANKWRGHLDLLSAAQYITGELMKTAPAARHAYLNSLRETDQKMIDIATRILSGSIDPALI